MTDRLLPGLVAIGAAALLALLALAPFVAISYRRRGTLTLRWTLGWFTLLTYVSGLLAYTMLPLPTPGTYRCAHPVFDPLEGFRHVSEYPDATPGELLANPAFQQVALNVILFLPLGAFARLMFRRGFWASVGIGAIASLAIELTQLTGLLGIYDCAYRVFDTNDLLTNVCGAALGWVVASLPGIRRLGRDGAPVDRDQPRPVTRRRRLLGMTVDVLIVGLTSVALELVVRMIAVTVFDVATTDLPVREIATAVDGALLGALLLYVLLTGATPGDDAVLLRYRVPGADRPPVPLRLVRAACGIGGYAALEFFAPGVSALLAVGIVIATLAAPHRGLPGLFTPLRLTDQRDRPEKTTVGGPRGGPPTRVALED